MIEELVRSFYEVPGRIIHLKKDMYLFQEGDEAKYFYFVRSGKIDIHKIVDTGKRLSLRLATKDSIIGEIPLYEEGPRTYIFDARAKEDSEVYAIDYVTLEAYLEKKHHLAINMLKLMGLHMRKQHSKFRDLLLYGKKGALYSTLIRLANSYGKKTDKGILLNVVLTNQDLANYSATTREGVNRMLNELKDADVIDFVDQHILIKNIAYLEEEIHCLHCSNKICNIM